MTERAHFVGICIGTDQDNPAVNNLGCMTQVITTSGKRQFDCTNLVYRDKCTALISKDEDVLSSDLPDCSVLRVLYSASPKEEKENSDLIKIQTTQGALIHNANTQEVLASPFLPEGHDPVNLTSAESRILTVLMRNQGRAVTRPILAEAMHPGEADFFVERTVNVHKSRLSVKLGENLKEGRIIIDTVHGVGYRIRNTEPNRH